MSALSLTFDQPGAGTPAGAVDRARTDIVSTGPSGSRAHPVLVTVAGIPAGATAEVQLLDEPPASNPLLTQQSPTQWQLDFDQGCWGPFRVRCNAVVDGRVEASVARRISIRSPKLLLHYPSLAERTDPNATLIPTAPSIALTEMNEGGTNRPMVNFFRSVVDALENFEGGGGGSALVYAADEPLSALRVVRLASLGRVRYARPPEVQARGPLGVTRTAASSGATVEVVDRGELQDASWNWTAGAPVLLGENGVLTQTQPELVPYLVVIGVAVTSTVIVVRIGSAIDIAA